MLESPPVGVVSRNAGRLIESDGGRRGKMFFGYFEQKPTAESLC